MSNDGKAPFFELQKQPPAKKGRNLKNLAVNTSRHAARAASTTSLPLQQLLNEDDADSITSLASPAFVRPPSPRRRKPSNLGLTLLTPGSSKTPPQEIRLAIPPTPAFKRPGTLRHFQSSPSLPLFPGLDSQSDTSQRNVRVPAALETILSPIEPPKRIHIVEQEEEEQNFDIPLSREEKPEAYPNGPICVHAPYIDLYLEPTVEQAREYDVIMNVASEVRNPFTQNLEPITHEPELRIDGGGGIQYAPKRLQLSVQPPDDATDNSPTTPKATPLNSSFPAHLTEVSTTKDPEYIHIPWEHNSDIVPDLLRLVKLIDEKVNENQRVLVHCQCGVSRSASLVVAYGLYKDPTLSVQEAYDAVKRRSKWIGPNMNLIMQLQEFRTSLTRGGLLPGNRGFTPITPSSAFNEWNRPLEDKTSDAESCDPPMSAGVVSTPIQTAEEASALSPGPSSAPSGLQWPIGDRTEPPPPPTQRARALSALKPASAYVDPSGHIVPVLKVVAPEPTHTDTSNRGDSASATPTESMASPSSAEFAMTPLLPTREADPADAFGLMSPSSTEFASSPFDRPTLLASLGMGSVREQDDVLPRRSTSLRSRIQQQSPTTSLEPSEAKRLRGKISSPSLREQPRPQNLQVRLEASLPRSPGLSVGVSGTNEALLSPRATESTHNPFALAVSEITSEDETRSEDPVTRSNGADPRSPAQVGVSPITRSILDVL